MENHQQSVGRIEGIGTAIARKLRQAGVFTIGDLIQLNIQSPAHPELNALSVERLFEWRQMATLMMIEGVSGQYAEAFYKSDIRNIEALSRSELSVLKAVFQAARRKRIIPEAPTADEITRMIADANRVHYSGKIAGVVRDNDHKACAGVTVSIKDLSVKTDRRGRYMLWRIPLHSTAPLVLKKAGFESQIDPSRQITASVDAIVNNVHRLNPPKDSTLVLREIAGDTLPEVSGFPIRIRRIRLGELQERDIFYLRRINADKDELELVSIFREYSDGVVYVPVLRIKQGSFKREPVQGTHWEYRHGLFHQRSFPGEGVDNIRMIRRFEKANKNFKPPTTARQLGRFSRAAFEFRRKEIDREGH